MPEEKRQQLGDIGRSAMTQGISCQQQEAMDGLKTLRPRRRTLTCSLCNGSGVSKMSLRPGGECAGCDGLGEFT